MSNASFAKNMVFLLILVTISPRAGGGEGEELLPGSQVSIDKAVHQSQLIVVARVDEPGKKNAGISGFRIRFSDLRLQVIKPLKGEVKNPRFGVDFRNAKPPAQGWETQPVKDGFYIFYLRTRLEQRPAAIKIMPATEDNVRATLTALNRETTI